MSRFGVLSLYASNSGVIPSEVVFSVVQFLLLAQFCIVDISLP